MGELRCVGYVKTMDTMEILEPELRIPAINLKTQKQHIHEYANKRTLNLINVYADEDINKNDAFLQLYDDAVHRRFDVLIVDSMYCFGKTIYEAADFINKVLLKAGFQVLFVESECKEMDEYIRYCLECSRIASLRISNKFRPKGANTRGKAKRKKFEIVYELSWYENRQQEIFDEMLSNTGDLENLETELRKCREKIKQLRRSENGKKKQA